MATHQIEFYGLSTCIHCRHAREFLEEHRQNFDITYLDKLEGEARAEALNKVRQYNPQISFPTLVIDGGKDVIVGFQPDAMTQALEL